MPHRAIRPNVTVTDADNDPEGRAGANLIKFALTVAFLALLAFLLLTYSAPGADAAVTCNKYAATNGSDGARGTSSAPFRTAQRLADSLAAGQVGCLQSGSYTERDDNLTIKKAGITLRRAPSAENPAMIKARVYVQNGADRATVRNLKLEGAPGFANVLIRADDTQWIENDITNMHRHSSCILVGSRYGDAAVATGTVISGNRIHDCGRLPRTNHDHGIYLSAARSTSIVDNTIYGNADRGIQLYPDANGTLIRDNTVKGNGQGILFSGAGRFVSSNNTVVDNVIVDSRASWNVTSSWNQTPKLGKSNVVRNNCVWALNRNSYYGKRGGINTTSGGFRAYDNRISAQCT